MSRTSEKKLNEKCEEVIRFEGVEAAQEQFGKETVNRVLGIMAKNRR